MSIKFKSKIFRKPEHWTKERYKEVLKEKNLFKNKKDLNDSINKKEKAK